MFQVSKVGKNQNIFNPFLTVLAFWTTPEQLPPCFLLLLGFFFKLATGFNMTGKMLKVKCASILWKQVDPEHGCCGETSPLASGRGSEVVDNRTRALDLLSRATKPPSVSEPVGDGQEQVILLQGLHPAQRLLIQSCVASPRVIQQLLLGRVKFPDLCHLLRGN